MARSIDSQTSFAGGIFGDILHSRPDLETHAIATKDILNFVVGPTGGLWRRPGTQYLSYSLAKSALIPFTPDDRLHYMIRIGEDAAGNNVFEFYTDRAQVVDGTGAIVTCPSPYQGDDACDIKYVQKRDSLVLVHPSYPPYEIKLDTPTSFICQDLPFENPPFANQNAILSQQLSIEGQPAPSNQGNVSFNSPIPVTFGIGSLFTFDAVTVAGGAPLGNITVTVTDISVSNSNTTTFIKTDYSGENIQPTALWSFDGTPGPGGVDANVIGYTPNPAINQGNMTANGFAPFTPDSVGQSYLIQCSSSGSTNYEVVTVTNYISPTEVETDWGGLECSATSDWRPNAFYEDNYPATVSCSDNRLIFANTIDSPNGMWLSEVGNPYSFLPFDSDGNVLPSSAIFVELNSQKTSGSLTSAIYWMQPEEEKILVGTNSGLYFVRPNRLGDALTAETITNAFQNSVGASPVSPVYVHDSAVYAGRCTKKVYNTYVKDNFGRVGSEERSLVVDQLLSAGVSDMVYQDCPHGVIWMTTNDGQLLGFTINARSKFYAWHRHLLGGTLFDEQCKVPVKVHKLSVVANTDRGTDDVYMIVERTVNGEQRFFMEVLSDFWTEGDSLNEARYVDCSVLYTGQQCPITLDSLGPGDVTIQQSLSADCPEIDSTPEMCVSLYDGQNYIAGEIVDDNTINIYAPNNCNEAPDGNIMHCVDDEWMLFDECDSIYVDGFTYKPPCSFEVNISSCVESLLGLDFLEGEILSGTVNGAAIFDSQCVTIESMQVINGELELPEPFFTSVVGLPYESKVEFLDRFGGTDRGFAFCQPFVLYGICVSTWESCDMEFGSGTPYPAKNTYSHYEGYSLPVQIVPNAPTELFTGYFVADNISDSLQEGELHANIRCRQPLPFHLRSVGFLINVQAGR